jgi:hypothetical protein
MSNTSHNLSDIENDRAGSAAIVQGSMAGGLHEHVESTAIF